MAVIATIRFLTIGYKSISREALRAVQVPRVPVMGRFLFGLQGCDMLVHRQIVLFPLKSDILSAIRRIADKNIKVALIIYEARDAFHKNQTSLQECFDSQGILMPGHLSCKRALYISDTSILLCRFYPFCRPQ